MQHCQPVMFLTERHTNLTRRISNETKPHIDHHVFALDSLPDLSPGRRHHPGMASGRVSNLFGVLILVVWLYGTLVLAERRSGNLIILLGSLLGSGIPSSTCWERVSALRQHCQVQRSLLLRLDAPCTRRDLSLLVILSVRGLWNLRRQPR